MIAALLLSLACAFLLVCVCRIGGREYRSHE
jgi:hypothetical protein